MEIFTHQEPKKEKILPLAPIREGVVFPHVVTILSFGRPKSMAAVEAAYKSGGLIALFSQKDGKITDPQQEDLYQLGTLAKIERLDHGDGGLQAWIRGTGRAELLSIEAEMPFLLGKVAELEEEAGLGDEIKAFAKVLINNFQEAINLGKSVDVLTIMHLMGENDPASLVDQIAYTLELNTEAKQGLLEISAVKKRLEKVAQYLNHETGVLKLEQAINHKTQRRFDRAMRETFLREKKKTIDEELGELSEEDEETKELEKKVKNAKMPAAVEEKAQKELKRLSRMNPNHPEYSYIRTYLDWLVEMPWSIKSPNETDINQAAKILDQDHYGLEKIKERIIEYLAVMKLKNGNAKPPPSAKSSGGAQDASGPTILCFIGPPGVGKTSIGKSIARALGRKFIRISLGGIRDEAEIRGHRRTYVGAMPGRIIQGIKNAGTNNPVFMLDEIDKVGADFRGDPSAALLEALDPEQNREFSDHYLEVPFDLSGVMFITTGNILDTIPPALCDRMEVIRFSGYTEEEKFNIVEKFLWTKELKANGLPENKIKLAPPAIYEIIRHYSREAGVRELERSLATVCRKIARRVAQNKNKTPKLVTQKDAVKFLGPRRYSQTLAEKKDEAGIITGLAYTESGGDILLIEVVLMPGKGTLLLTGQLGKVMQESAKAALSYVRSRWQALGLKKDFYKNIDIHIHVPEGAVPKDGPSAGVAITTGLISALTCRKARREVGMTGEITLRGRVLEIGGVKEKLIAAHRAGLTTVIMPKDNKKDLVDVPDKVKKDIKFVFVTELEQVLPVALR